MERMRKSQAYNMQFLLLASVCHFIHSDLVPCMVLFRISAFQTIIQLLIASKHFNYNAQPLKWNYRQTTLTHTHNKHNFVAHIIHHFFPFFSLLIPETKKNSIVQKYDIFSKKYFFATGRKKNKKKKHEKKMFDVAEIFVYIRIQKFRIR